MMVYCCLKVCDDGPTLNQHWVNVLFANMSSLIPSKEGHGLVILTVYVVKKRANDTRYPVCFSHTSGLHTLAK